MVRHWGFGGSRGRAARQSSPAHGEDEPSRPWNKRGGGDRRRDSSAADLSSSRQVKMIKRGAAKLKRRGGKDDEDGAAAAPAPKKAPVKKVWGRTRGGRNRKDGPIDEVATPWLKEGTGAQRGKTGANTIEVTWRPAGADEASEDERDKKPKSPTPPPARGPAGRGGASTLPAWMTAGSATEMAPPPALPDVAASETADPPQRRSPSPLRGAGRGRGHRERFGREQPPPSIPRDDREDDRGGGKGDGRGFRGGKGGRKGGRRELSRSRSPLSSRRRATEDTPTQPAARDRPWKRDDDAAPWSSATRWTRDRQAQSHRVEKPWNNNKPTGPIARAVTSSDLLIVCQVHRRKRTFDKLIANDQGQWVCRPEEECATYIGGSNCSSNFTLRLDRQTSPVLMHREEPRAEAMKALPPPPPPPPRGERGEGSSEQPDRRGSSRELEGRRPQEEARHQRSPRRSRPRSRDRSSDGGRRRRSEERRRNLQSQPFVPPAEAQVAQAASTLESSSAAWQTASLQEQAAAIDKDDL